MSTRDSSEEHQQANDTAGIYAQPHFDRFGYLDNVSRLVAFFYLCVNILKTII